jgi:hypothetical protein
MEAAHITSAWNRRGNGRKQNNFSPQMAQIYADKYEPQKNPENAIRKNQTTAMQGNH